MNYIRIALRNLLKNRTSSFINIGGLGVGMSMYGMRLQSITTIKTIGHWRR